MLHILIHDENIRAFANERLIAYGVEEKVKAIGLEDDHDELIVSDTSNVEYALSLVFESLYDYKNTARTPSQKAIVVDSLNNFKKAAKNKVNAQSTSYSTAGFYAVLSIVSAATAVGLLIMGILLPVSFIGACIGAGLLLASAAVFAGLSIKDIYQSRNVKQDDTYRTVKSVKKKLLKHLKKEVSNIEKMPYDEPVTGKTAEQGHPSLKESAVTKQSATINQWAGLGSEVLLTDDAKSETTAAKELPPKESSSEESSSGELASEEPDGHIHQKDRKLVLIDSVNYTVFKRPRKQPRAKKLTPHERRQQLYQPSSSSATERISFLKTETEKETFRDGLQELLGGAEKQQSDKRLSDDCESGSSIASTGSPKSTVVREEASPDTLTL